VLFLYDESNQNSGSGINILWHPRTLLYVIFDDDTSKKDHHDSSMRCNHNVDTNKKTPDQQKMNINTDNNNDTKMEEEEWEDMIDGAIAFTVMANNQLFHQMLVNSGATKEDDDDTVSVDHRTLPRRERRQFKHGEALAASRCFVWQGL
jgi:hypothetical protein